MGYLLHTEDCARYCNKTNLLPSKKFPPSSVDKTETQSPGHKTMYTKSLMIMRTVSTARNHQRRLSLPTRVIGDHFMRKWDLNLKLK